MEPLDGRIGAALGDFVGDSVVLNRPSYLGIAFWNCCL